MKRATYLILHVVVLISLVACGATRSDYSGKAVVVDLSYEPGGFVASADCGQMNCWKSDQWSATVRPPDAEAFVVATNKATYSQLRRGDTVTLMDGRIQS
ncbi:MAG: hypothetical protein EOO17_05965 [Chloroflexi bacterium]|nr:MAG: hypothetical protein EOO17_05965 [Chloroflexota bacterium]